MIHLGLPESKEHSLPYSHLPTRRGVLACLVTVQHLGKAPCPITRPARMTLRALECAMLMAAECAVGSVVNHDEFSAGLVRRVAIGHRACPESDPQWQAKSPDSTYRRG